MRIICYFPMYLWWEKKWSTNKVALVAGVALEGCVPWG